MANRFLDILKNTAKTVVSPVLFSDIGAIKKKVIKDDSTAGIVANTITGIPEATKNVFKDILQGVARNVASVGITAGNIPSELRNKMYGQNVPDPFDKEIDTSKNRFSRILFGEKPVRTIQGQVENVKKIISPYVGEKFAGMSALPLVGLGIALDLSGFGGKAGVKTFGEIPEQFFKYVAKEKDASIIENTLKKIGLDDINAKNLAPELAKTKTVDEAKEALSIFGNEKPTENVFSNILKSPKATPETTITPEMKNITTPEIKLYSEPKSSEIGPLFTPQEMENLNRNSYFSPDWNKDYKNSIENVLVDAKLDINNIPDGLKNEWQRFINTYTPEYKKALNIRSDNISPVVAGPAKFNYARRDKLFDREKNTFNKMEEIKQNFLKKVNSYKFQTEKTRKLSLSEVEKLEEQLSKAQKNLDWASSRNDAHFTDFFTKKIKSLERKIFKLENDNKNIFANPEATSDVSRITRLRDSINEGKTLLKNKNLQQGEKEMIVRSIDNAQSKIGVEKKDGYTIEEITSDQIFNTKKPDIIKHATDARKERLESEGYISPRVESKISADNIKDQISFMEEVISNHPGKQLVKYISKSTGRLPEVLGKRDGVGGKFQTKGDSILQEIAGYGKDADEIIEEYKSMKESVSGLKEMMREAKTEAMLNKISEKLAKHQQKMLEFSKKYPELARFTLKLSEEQTKGAIKGYKLGIKTVSRTIKKEVMDKVKTAYDKKVANIKDNKEILQNRRTLIRAVQKQFGLSDGDLKSITQRDIRLMTNFEFKEFLDNIRAKSEEFMVRRQAQNELVAQIQEKELNIEPLRQALELPPISQMTTSQLRELDATLEPYMKGDVFLSQRKLETIERTDLSGVKTYREVREILAKKIGVKPEELNNIQINEFDRLKSFSTLGEKNPFFKMIVEDVTKLRLMADAEYLQIEKKVNSLAKKVKTTLGQKLIPQQKNIRAWFEAKDKSTIRLTKEESELTKYMVEEWSKARDTLIINQVMNRGIIPENYFTHIRRGVLEAIKEDGVVIAFKELFDQYKLDEQVFNIMDTETGEVLAMDKFFRFALRRTGELKPTENIVGAFLTYMKMFKRKEALDAMVPLVDTYAHSVTPKGQTQKGLLLHGDIIRFMKEWLNTQKGRRITLLAKQGGKIDWALRSGKAVTTLLDLGLNIPVTVATQVGEQAIQYQLLGKRRFVLAKLRALTPKGRRITNKYRNLIGKNPWSQLVEPMRDIGDRLNEGIFAMFQDANVRRNRNVLLGSLTPKEWATETISPERLAQIKLATGRYGVVDGIGSIVGATPESKLLTQYKSWAIPILNSQIRNTVYIAKYLASKGTKNPEMAKRAFKEIYRMLELGLFTVIVGSAFVDKEDDTFLGKLKQRAYQEAMTLFGAGPAVATVPRMVTFLTDLAKNMATLITLEKYKANKFGEYEEGQLKGPKAILKQFTPRAVKQFDQPKVKTIDDVKKEIKEKIESGELSVQAGKELFINEVKKLQASEKAKRFELPFDEYKADLKQRIQNKEITVADAKEEFIDYSNKKIETFESKDEKTFIQKVSLYAKAVGTDPVTAFVFLFGGEKIRRIDNGAIIVYRGKSDDPNEQKQFSIDERAERGATKEVILDHTIPLQLGGGNEDDNLKLVSINEWENYTPVENYLGDALRSGSIEKKEAQDLIIKFKNGEITAEDVYNYK